MTPDRLHCRVRKQDRRRDAQVQSCATDPRHGPPGHASLLCKKRGQGEAGQNKWGGSGYGGAPNGKTKSSFSERVPPVGFA